MCLSPDCVNSILFHWTDYYQPINVPLTKNVFINHGFPPLAWSCVSVWWQCEDVVTNTHTAPEGLRVGWECKKCAHLVHELSSFCIICVCGFTCLFCDKARWNEKKYFLNKTVNRQKSNWRLSQFSWESVSFPIANGMFSNQTLLIFNLDFFDRWSRSAEGVDGGFS